jgi:hypothetical protein
MVNKTELTEKEIWREIKRDDIERKKSNRVIFSYIKRIPFISLFNKLSVNFWEMFNVACFFLFGAGLMKVFLIIPISDTLLQFIVLLIPYGFFCIYIMPKWARFSQDMTCYIKKMRRLENIYRIRKERKHYSEITVDLRELF